MHSITAPDGGGFTNTCLLAILTVILNLTHYVQGASEVLHLIGSCATIGAACTTIVVGLLTIKKLRREK